MAHHVDDEAVDLDRQGLQGGRVLRRPRLDQDEARATQDPAALEALAVEIDGLVIDVVRHARANDTDDLDRQGLQGGRVLRRPRLDQDGEQPVEDGVDAGAMSALILAVDAARAAVADCRRDGAPVRERSGRVLSSLALRSAVTKPSCEIEHNRPRPLAPCFRTT
jgi:hypothetical protein